MKSKVKYQGVRYSMKHFEIAMLNDIVPMDTQNMKFYYKITLLQFQKGQPICILFGQHLAHPPAALLRQQCSEGLQLTGFVQSGSSLSFTSFTSFISSRSQFQPIGIFGQHSAHPPAALFTQQCSSVLQSTDFVQSGSSLSLQQRRHPGWKRVLRQQCSLDLQSTAKVLPMVARRQMKIRILFIIFAVTMVLDKNTILQKIIKYKLYQQKCINAKIMAKYLDSFLELLITSFDERACLLCLKMNLKVLLYYFTCYITAY